MFLVALEDADNDMKYRENIQQSLGTETKKVWRHESTWKSRVKWRARGRDMTGKLVSPSRKSSRGSKEREKTP